MRAVSDIDRIYIANRDESDQPINEMVAFMKSGGFTFAVDIGSKEVKLIFYNPKTDRYEIVNLKKFMNQPAFNDFKQAYELMKSAERDSDRTKSFYEELRKVIISQKQSSIAPFTYFNEDNFYTKTTLIQGGGIFVPKDADVKAGNLPKHDLSDQPEFQMKFTYENPIISAWLRASSAVATDGFNDYLREIAKTTQPVIIGVGAPAAVLDPLRKNNPILSRVVAKLLDQRTLVQLFKANKIAEDFDGVVAHLVQCFDVMPAGGGVHGLGVAAGIPSTDSAIYGHLLENLGIGRGLITRKDGIKSAIERAPSNFLHRTLLLNLPLIEGFIRNSQSLSSDEWTLKVIICGPGSSNPAVSLYFESNIDSSKCAAYTFVLPQAATKDLLAAEANINASALEICFEDEVKNIQNWQQIMTTGANTQIFDQHIKPLVDSIQTRRDVISGLSADRGPTIVVSDAGSAHEFERRGSDFSPSEVKAPSTLPTHVGSVGDVGRTSSLFTPCKEGQVKRKASDDAGPAVGVAFTAEAARRAGGKGARVERASSPAASNIEEVTTGSPAPMLT